MVRIKFTTHASEDREERMVRIATTIGFGEIVDIFKWSNEHGPTRHCITDTGILIIKDEHCKTIITMYALKEEQLHRYYPHHAPSWLMQIVRNNQKKRKFLYEF